MGRHRNFLVPALVLVALSIGSAAWLWSGADRASPSSATSPDESRGSPSPRLEAIPPEISDHTAVGMGVVPVLPAHTGVVALLVRDESGAPVTGAEIVAVTGRTRRRARTIEGEPRACTDEGGTVVVSSFAPEVEGVSIVAAGFLPKVVDPPPSGTTTTVVLGRGIEVRVLCRDLGGAPVEGVLLTCSRRPFGPLDEIDPPTGDVAGATEPLSIHRGRSDSGGLLLLRLPDPGTWYFALSHATHAVIDRRPSGTFDTGAMFTEVRLAEVHAAVFRVRSLDGAPVRVSVRSSELERGRDPGRAADTAGRTADHANRLRRRFPDASVVTLLPLGADGTSSAIPEINVSVSVAGYVESASSITARTRPMSRIDFADDYAVDPPQRGPTGSIEIEVVNHDGTPLPIRRLNLHFGTDLCGITPNKPLEFRSGRYPITVPMNECLLATLSPREVEVQADRIVRCRLGVDRQLHRVRIRPEVAGEEYGALIRYRLIDQQAATAVPLNRTTSFDLWLPEGSFLLEAETPGFRAAPLRIDPAGGPSELRFPLSPEP